MCVRASVLSIVLGAALVPAAAASSADSSASALRPVRAGKLTIGIPAGWRTSRPSSTVALVAAPAVQTTGSLTAASVTSGRPPAGTSLQQWKASAVAALRSARLPLSRAAARIVRLPGGRAVELAFTGRLGSTRVRWLTYAFASGPKAYVVIFMSDASS